MKHIFLFLFIALIACNPKNKQPDTVKIEKKEMTIEAFISEFGFDPFPDTASTARRKPPKAVVVVWFNDLVFDGSTFTTSNNPKFAGVQNLTTMMSICNWFFYTGSAQTLICTNETGSGNIRAWNSDYDENIHISNVIVK